ncbi:UTP--glucose-1-phosphate uridylyltransferase [Allopseudospirillum japonicum]|uniref:UTP--glucose-1-phosphate uridylyltransferase n=1 Tax=Allopseudospirillum japonicum TaxID=64971 RepID=A0A1H6T9Y1_9GAMM|nr:UTP--glucose-1-phosphate uridylyltransferase [Allopseudospirillum japonicum]SEI74954.1 UTP--glucose-1-phosphate uridylyltransferase [Allopseudospirillum japonicum]
MPTHIKTGVIPVAGLGTRLLPATKAIPKEMVTLVDRPAIQYVVEEAAQAGLQRLVLVTRTGKEAIADHFDTHYELEHTLAARNKQTLLEAVQAVKPADMQIICVRQPQAQGLGHAILCAQEVIGQEEEAFAVLLPDMLIDSRAYQHALTPYKNDLAAMLAAYQATQQGQIMLMPVAQDQVQKYGIAALAAGKQQLAAGEYAPLSQLVEKPQPEQAPSQLAVVGRYILPRILFSYLAQTPVGAGNEIQLTDALAALLQDHKLSAYCMHGQVHDCGDPMGFLQANVHYGCQHPVWGKAFSAYLQQYLASTHLL